MSCNYQNYLPGRFCEDCGFDFESVKSKAEERREEREGEVRPALQKKDPSGWMFMKDMGMFAKLSGWKSRWFVLKVEKERLYYYKSSLDVGKHEPLGYIPLQHATAVKSVEPTGRKGSTIGNKHFEFVISTPEQDYNLYTESQEWRQFWSDHLAEMVEGIKEREEMAKEDLVMENEDQNVVLTKDEISVRCGWLTKVRVFGLGHTKKWCVLRDGILYLFKEKGRSRGAAKYPLYHSKLEDSSNNNYCFTLVCQSGSVSLICEDAEEMMMWINAILKQTVVVEQQIDSITMH